MAWFGGLNRFIAWFFVIGGAILIALGTQERMSKSPRSFVQNEKYTEESCARYAAVEGYLNMTLGLGFMLEGLASASLSLLPGFFFFVGGGIMAFSIIGMILAMKRILVKRSVYNPHL